MGDSVQWPTVAVACDAGSAPYPVCFGNFRSLNEQLGKGPWILTHLSNSDFEDQGKG